jgi:uncharacterized membrane protein (UPF0136 family)
MRRRKEPILNVIAITSILYGALVFIGGWMGFKKAGSRASLVSGAVAEALLLVAAVLALTGRDAGAKLAMAVAFVLLAFFGYRFARGRKFMPAGLMVIASFAALALIYFSRPALP